MKGRLVILSICLFISYILYAIPASRNTIVRQLSTGEEVRISMVGDEHYHHYVTSDGRWVKQSGGKWVETDSLSIEEQGAMRQLSMQRRAPQQVKNQRFLPAKGLIILANFADVKFQSENTLKSMQDMHSGDNYTFDGATGSCKQYFSDVSFGKYVPQFDVVGPVQLSRNMAHYGGAVNYWGASYNDYHASDMVIEACQLADTEFNVNFADYDNDNDGEVDYVYIVYAGYSEATTGNSEDCIWPHSSDVSGERVRLDGKLLSKYACSSELQGVDGEWSARCGIGTFCHEFSHVMGLPDFYETAYSSLHKTLGDWDIMDSGPYLNDGKTPPAYSAYERWYMGWLTPEYLNSGGEYELNGLNKSGEIFIVTESKEPNYNGVSPNPTEFYLIENRQNEGWDRYLPGHGMLLTHVRFSARLWDNNTPNDSEKSMCVDLVEADGVAPHLMVNNDESTYNEAYYGKATDAFPSGSTSCNLFEGKQIRDIKENDGKISFTFFGGEEPHTVLFNVGEYGTVSVTERTENKVGAGIILPNVNVSNNDYEFIGWSTEEGALVANAGPAFARYYPEDDITLYAVYKKKSDILLQFDLVGAVRVSGAEEGQLSKQSLIEVSFTALDIYSSLSSPDVEIGVYVGGEKIDAELILEDEILTIIIAEDLTTDDIKIVVHSVIDYTKVECNDYEYLFTEALSVGNVELNDRGWRLNMEGNTTTSISSASMRLGLVIGSSSNPTTHFVLEEQEEQLCRVEQVIVRASKGNGGTGQIVVKIGNEAVGDLIDMTGNSKEYTFTPSVPKTGKVAVEMVNTKGAMYIRSINIKYASNESGSDIVPMAQGSDRIIGVYNIMGQKIEVGYKTTNLDLRGLPIGVYIVVTESGSYKILNL